VLAVVDKFSVGNREGGGAAAEKRAGFVQVDFEAGRAERGGGGQPGQSPSGDD